MMTRNDPAAVLPAPSVELQFTVVAPSANVDPEPGEHVTAVLPLTTSPALALNATTRPATLVASALIGDGSESVGAVVSRTVTVNEPLPVLPAASVELQFTVVAPGANVEPEAGAHANAGLPLTASLALAANVTTWPAALVASTTMGEGSDSAGAVVS